jgi:hypothetical protein
MRMRRFVASGVAAAFLLGLAGCGGGGIEEGIPQDQTPGKPISIDNTDTLKMKKIGDAAHTAKP